MGQTNDRAEPRKQRKGAQEKAPRFDSSRFVNYELDTAEQAQCKGWDLSADDLWQEVQAMVDSGYGFSVKFDTFSEAYACFVRYAGQDGHPNTGFILTGRGSTCGKAVKQAIFKHRAIGAAWGEHAESRKPIIDD